MTHYTGPGLEKIWRKLIWEDGSVSQVFPFGVWNPQIHVKIWARGLASVVLIEMEKETKEMSTIGP